MYVVTTSTFETILTFTITNVWSIRQNLFT